MGELKKVLQYNKDLSKVIFVGPAKREFELEFAIKNNIYMIVVESKTELKRIEKICKKLGRKVDILIRVNPNFNSGGVINMSGVTQFGLSKDEVAKLIIKKYNYINIKGLHFYLGTNILSEEKVVNNIHNIIELAKEIKTFFNFRIIDIGLGLGIAYYKSDKDLNIEYLIDEINNIIKKSQFDIFLELGRFLVAKSGIFIAQVVDRKNNFGKKFSCF